MLTRRRVRPLLAAVVAALLVLAGATAGTAIEVPEGCTLETVPTDDGSTKYVVTCPGDGGGSEDGGSGNGSVEPTCELTGLADYCIGASACWANVPSALDPADWPEETRPSPEAIYTYQSCDPDLTGELSGWAWYEPEEVSVADLARQAFGSLHAPAFDVGVNPPRQAVLGVPTWFWADTAQAGTIQGSSAMGVVAIGEPDRIEVDPGDGSGVVSCGWATAESATCSHTYLRSSAREPADSSGLPSYTARMRMVYDVRFENGGVGLTVPGLPSSLESPWQEVSVPVAEVQSVVG